MATVTATAAQMILSVVYSKIKMKQLKVSLLKKKRNLERRFLSGLLLLVLSPVITGLVNLTPEAGKYLRGMLLICSYYLVGKSINSMTISGIFQAVGDSKFGLFCDIVTLWCITIPLGCFCAFVCRLPLLFVYFVLNLDEIVKLPAVYWHYKKYDWVKNITNGIE